MSIPEEVRNRIGEAAEERRMEEGKPKKKETKSKREKMNRKHKATSCGNGFPASNPPTPLLLA